MGTPLIKNIVKNGNNTKYITGILTSGKQSEKGFFYRFIRISYAMPFITKVLETLLPQEETNGVCSNSSSSSKKDLSDTSIKRPKHW